MTDEAPRQWTVASLRADVLSELLVLREWRGVRDPDRVARSEVLILIARTLGVADAGTSDTTAVVELVRRFVHDFSAADQEVLLGALAISRPEATIGGKAGRRAVVARLRGLGERSIYRREEKLFPELSRIIAEGLFATLPDEDDLPDEYGLRPNTKFKQLERLADYDGNPAVLLMLVDQMYRMIHTALYGSMDNPEAVTDRQELVGLTLWAFSMLLMVSANDVDPLHEVQDPGLLLGFVHPTGYLDATHKLHGYPQLVATERAFLRSCFNTSEQDSYPGFIEQVSSHPTGQRLLARFDDWLGNPDDLSGLHTFTRDTMDCIAALKEIADFPVRVIGEPVEVPPWET